MSLKRLFTFPTLLPCALLLSPVMSVLADCNSEEVGYVASFKVKAGNEAQFEAAIAELAATVMRVERASFCMRPTGGPKASIS